jgi:hypothetical protein
MSSSNTTNSYRQRQQDYPRIITSPSTTSKLEELMAMGYSKAECTQALKVSSGDMEQAVGFLLLGENSKRGFNFDFSFSELITRESDLPFINEATTTASTEEDEEEERWNIETARRIAMEATANRPSRNNSTPGTAVSCGVEDQLISMGYDRDAATQALRVSNGDLEQAVAFLMMGESRHGFLTDTSSDAELAAALQSSSSSSPHPSIAVGRVLPDEQPPPLRSTGPKPRIVATTSFLSVPGSGPFAACSAASKFLAGGVVNATFLHGIMESAIELYRKAYPNGTSNKMLSIQSVIKKYGKSHLGIQAEIDENKNEPKQGIFMSQNLQDGAGMRKLLAACRNEQQTGWQVIVIELHHNNDSFCVCLPPKGSANKFWFLDFVPRPTVNTPGAYALVHTSLLQMEESVESVLNAISIRDEVEFVPFKLYNISKVVS